jgi:hypothetical protein
MVNLGYFTAKIKIKLSSSFQNFVYRIDTITKFHYVYGLRLKKEKRKKKKEKR